MRVSFFLFTAAHSTSFFFFFFQYIRQGMRVLTSSVTLHVVFFLSFFLSVSLLFRVCAFFPFPHFPPTSHSPGRHCHAMLQVEVMVQVHGESKPAPGASLGTLKYAASSPLAGACCPLPVSLAVGKRGRGRRRGTSPTTILVPNTNHHCTHGRACQIIPCVCQVLHPPFQPQ